MKRAWSFIKGQKKNPSHRRGQGMVEFALIFPLVLLMILGVIEGGHFLFFYSTLSAASREGARYGEGTGTSPTDVNYKNCQGIRDRVNAIGAFANIQTVTITYDSGGGTVNFANCNPNFNPLDPAVKINASTGDRIVVSVTGNYQPLVPLPHFPSLPFTSVSSRTIINQNMGEEEGSNPQQGTTCDQPDARPDIHGLMSYDITSLGPPPVYNYNKVYVQFYQPPGGPDVKVTALDITWTVTSGQKLDSIRFGGISILSSPDNTGHFHRNNTNGIVGLMAGYYQYMILTFQKPLSNETLGPNHGLPTVTVTWEPNPACPITP